MDSMWGPCVQAIINGDLAALEAALAGAAEDDLEQALSTAVEKDRCDMLPLLLDHGVAADARRVSYYRTALFAAADGYGFEGQYCRMDAAIMLLDAGADVNHSDLDGYTPLIEAAHGGHLEMLRLLLRRGAKHDASFYVEADGMSIGGTAEDMAKAQGHDECVALLSGVRLAGGWKKWVSIPRKQLVVLRVLCERGRASTEDALLARLFPSNAPEAMPDAPDPRVSPTTRAELVQLAREDPDALQALVSEVLREAARQNEAAPTAEEAEEDDDEAASRARVAPRGEVPKEVFWHVLEYWQSSRD